MTYTLSQHIEAYQIARQRANGGTPLPTYVQIKIGPETVCARILDYWESREGVGLWHLELLPPFSGRTHLAMESKPPAGCGKAKRRARRAACAVAPMVITGRTFDDAS